MVIEIIWDDSMSSWADNLADQRIEQAVRAAAALRGFEAGEIGVRLTDNASIHEINARHLSHDYPTDVISFPYNDSDGQLEGELVASVETAVENAADVGWDPSNELLLYVIHGVLHIAGMDDHSDQDRAEMRAAEKSVLHAIGITAPGSAVYSGEGVSE